MKSKFLKLAMASLAFACISQAQASLVATEGSTSMEKAIGSLGEAFMHKNKDLNFTYNPTGSSAGILATIDERTNIGLSSRNLKEDEQEKLDTHTLAYDAIVLIVNKNNKIDNLSTQDINDLFEGKIKNWKELGGADSPVVLIGREMGSGTRDGFETATNTQNKIKYRQELTSTGDVVTTVSQNKNAIGYASLSSNLKRVKVLSVNNVYANFESIQDKSYVIQRPFLMLTKKGLELNQSTKDFIEFTKSQESTDILLKLGLIPFNNK